MKKSSIYIIFILFLICLAFLSCANEPVNNEPLNTELSPDLQTKFYGLWHYPKNNFFYTISKDTLIARKSVDNTGFTARITGWEYIKNTGKYSEEYPEGFIITAIIEKMTGSWVIGDTWTWFLNKNGASLITDTGVIYQFIESSLVTTGSCPSLLKPVNYLSWQLLRRANISPNCAKLTQ
jgi:hypothetical protein